MPPSASSKRPIAALVGSREGAPLVPEELGLEQLLRQGGAVDADEGPVARGLFACDVVRDAFLARAALPRDQDRALGGGHALGRLEQSRPSGGRLGDQLERRGPELNSERKILVLLGQAAGAFCTRLDDDARSPRGLQGLTRKSSAPSDACASTAVSIVPWAVTSTDGQAAGTHRFRVFLNELDAVHARACACRSGPGRSCRCRTQVIERRPRRCWHDVSLKPRGTRTASVRNSLERESSSMMRNTLNGHDGKQRSWVLRGLGFRQYGLVGRGFEFEDLGTAEQGLLRGTTLDRCRRAGVRWSRPGLARDRFPRGVVVYRKGSKHLRWTDGRPEYQVPRRQSRTKRI